jgi:hypothetical protein
MNGKETHYFGSERGAIHIVDNASAFLVSG